VADQPAKVYPVRVGSVGASKPPPERKFDPDTLPPPLESNVTVYTPPTGVTALDAAEDPEEPTEFVAVTVKV
jgi:hypothetical protein